MGQDLRDQGDELRNAKTSPKDEAANVNNGFLSFSASIADKIIKNTSKEKLVKDVNSLGQVYYSLFPAAQKVGLGEEEKAKCSGFLDKVVTSRDEGGRAHYEHMTSTGQLNSFSEEYSEKFHELIHSAPYSDLIKKGLEGEFSKGQQCTIRKFCDAHADGVDVFPYLGGKDGFAYKFSSKPEQYYHCDADQVPSIYSKEFIEFSCHFSGVEEFQCETLSEGA